MVHAFTNGAGFAATDALLRRGLFTPWPYVVLWALLNGTNLLTVFFFKAKLPAGTRSFVERQMWLIWSTYVGAAALVAVCNLMLGLDRMFAGTAMAVLAAYAFAMMGTMGRRWFVAAGAFGLAALVASLLPRWQFTIVGLLFATFQFVGGALLHTERRRRLSAAGGVAPPRLV
jgi:UDP-N-acetylmuramyl pentapeptide phosphotransferase/UDP-N-acetylglucosamine-1-phosphate transferase